MVNHLLDLLLADLLAQFLCSGHQVVLSDIPFSIFVEVFKDTSDIFLGVGVAGVAGHQLDELVEGDLTSVVGIED